MAAVAPLLPELPLRPPGVITQPPHSAIIQGGMMQLIHLTMYDYVSGIKLKVSSTGFEILVKKLEILARNLDF